MHILLNKTLPVNPVYGMVSGAIFSVRKITSISAGMPYGVIVVDNTHRYFKLTRKDFYLLP